MSTSVPLTFVGSYNLQPRQGRTFREIMREYNSIEISFLSSAMDACGFTDSSVIMNHLPEMSLLRNDVAATTRDIHHSLKVDGYRAVGWCGVFVFAAQHQETALLHSPIALGDKPFISTRGGSCRQRRLHKHVHYMQARQEYQGHRETDLELQVAHADPKTGLWAPDTTFLVTHSRY